MKKTRIDWADATWNPITGCLHGCPYCYARGIARRFAGLRAVDGKKIIVRPFEASGISVLNEPMRSVEKNGPRIAPYPMGFAPTFHRYLLDQPSHWKTPRTVFTCSMADLFGSWVPDEWIEAVYEACARASWHRYLFLTKNPHRLAALFKAGCRLPPTIDAWYGYTYQTGEPDALKGRRAFVSIEPILENIPDLNFIRDVGWVIVGAETGKRKEKIVPERRWIERISDECEYYGTPLLMKESLRELMGERFTQEFPWDTRL